MKTSLAIVGFITGGVLTFPGLALAAPTLSSYTLTYSTIYPSATAGSGLPTSTAIDVAFSEAVKVTIKILSADGSSVKTLYSSSSVTNPSAKTWDGTDSGGSKVSSGTYTISISATSVASEEPLDDTSKTITVSSPDSGQVATSTPQASSSSGSTTYVPPPSSISVSIQGDEGAFLEVPLLLSARVTTKNGAIDSNARVVWSFGDGSSATGSDVEKTYRYPGSYLVVAAATDGSAKARDEMLIEVSRANIRISAITAEGITVANDSNERIDMSGWRLTSDTGSFKIPDGMIVLPRSSAFFPYAITNLPYAFDAALWYPDGIPATRYVLPKEAATAVEPNAATTSYKEVQKVEPIISTAVITPIDDSQPALAPAAVPERIAAGADAPVKKTAFFTSPWTLGFFGVVALAGTAFIFL